MHSSNIQTCKAGKLTISRTKVILLTICKQTLKEYKMLYKIIHLSKELLIVFYTYL